MNAVPKIIKNLFFIFGTLVYNIDVAVEKLLPKGGHEMTKNKIIKNWIATKTEDYFLINNKRIASDEFKEYIDFAKSHGEKPLGKINFYAALNDLGVDKCRRRVNGELKYILISDDVIKIPESTNTLEVVEVDNSTTYKSVQDAFNAFIMNEKKNILNAISYGLLTAENFRDMIGLWGARNNIIELINLSMPTIKNFANYWGLIKVGKNFTTTKSAIINLI